MHPHKTTIPNQEKKKKSIMLSYTHDSNDAYDHGWQLLSETEPDVLART